MLLAEAVMDERLSVQCARCRIPKGRRACDSVDGAAPRGCPTRLGGEALAKARALCAEPAIAPMAYHASCQEAAGYECRGTTLRPVLTRVEETCGFAQRMGYRRLGLAFCAGLIGEAAALDRVLAARGFEVISAVCKVGAVPKESLGLREEEKLRPGQFESMCNPLGQAELLNAARTDFNIVLGLCVGHDSLFLRHAEAPCTVLAVKDRLLCHNPLAALYTVGSYYKSLLEEDVSTARRGSGGRDVRRRGGVGAARDGATRRRTR